MKSRVLIVAVLSLFALFGAACKSTIGLSVVVDADGGGEISIGIQVDPKAEKAIYELTGKSFSDSYAVSDVAAAGWKVARLRGPDGSSGVSVTRRFGAPEEAGAMLRAIAGRPPVVFETFELNRSDGLLRVEFDLAMTINLRSKVLSDTVAAAIGKAEFSKLSTGFGISLTDGVSAEVRVALPGTISSNNAQAVEGSILVWSVKGGERLEMTAKSAYFQWPYVGGAAVVGVSGISLVVLLASDVRRRRRARSAPAASADPLGETQ
ncbi:MAG: hypothetical protein DCC49_06820 [Acidobacteria bacterium]|nr:MAG: hypothetical protein DCC49_06820 [Acidobacteriota bacterium]